MTRLFTLDSAPVSTIQLNWKEELNEQQLAAVTCGDGPKLVIAGAGSGKTRTITYRVAYLIANGVPPSAILLATFTNKAAREMVARVEVMIGSAVGKVWAGTFHSLGNRILRHYATLVGFAPNYSILDDQDQRDLLKVCVAELKVKVEDKRFPAAAILQDILSLCFNTEQPLKNVLEARYPHFAMWEQEIQRVAALYDRKKRATNVMDYDDLLRHWLVLLQQHPEVTTRLGQQFRYLLVDEYQDTNTIQAEIIERLAAQNGYNLMVVGDDAQSIYAFRGANYDNILKFPERNPGTELFKLERNYRSTPPILAFTNASIQQNQRQHRKTLQAVRKDGALPVVIPVNDAYQEAAFVAQRLLQLRDEGVPLTDMAVLYRAHAHSTILQAELVRRNIPYEIRSGVRFFEQAHIKDVVAYLKIFDNPRDEIAWRRVLLTLPRIGNATAGRVWSVMSQAPEPLRWALSAEAKDHVPAGARPAFQQFQQELQRLAVVRSEESPASLITAILDTSYADYLKATYDSAQSRAEDIQQLAVFAAPYRTLSSLLSELVLLGELYGQDVGADTGTDQERLVLSSVHQAKGLEWKVVFVVRMCEGDFPSPMGLRETDGEEEERRIFYVATTRAKDELYLLHPLIDMGPRGAGSLLLQPSRFLQEIPFTLYEQGEIADTRPLREWD